MSASRDIQCEFDHVRDSLNKIGVPSTIKVNYSDQGIEKACRPTLKVISKRACFSENRLKIIRQINESDTNEIVVQKQQIQDLFTVFSAQINFLQA